MTRSNISTAADAYDALPINVFDIDIVYKWGCFVNEQAWKWNITIGTTRPSTIDHPTSTINVCWLTRTSTISGRMKTATFRLIFSACQACILITLCDDRYYSFTYRALPARCTSAHQVQPYHLARRCLNGTVPQYLAVVGDTHSNAMPAY